MGEYDGDMDQGDISGDGDGLVDGFEIYCGDRVDQIWCWIRGGR